MNRASAGEGGGGRMTRWTATISYARIYHCKRQRACNENKTEGTTEVDSERAEHFIIAFSTGLLQYEFANYGIKFIFGITDIITFVSHDRYLLLFIAFCWHVRAGVGKFGLGMIGA